MDLSLREFEVYQREKYYWGEIAEEIKRKEGRKVSEIRRSVDI